MGLPRSCRRTDHGRVTAVGRTARTATNPRRGGLGYGQYCPISHALDIVGERWTLLIVRDLICGTTRFNDLARGLPGLSRTLLAKRLRRLERSGVIDHLDGEYLLTPAGRALEPVVFGLGAWGAQWSFGEPDPREQDPELLVWWMHRRVDTSGMPGRRQVVKVDFTDDPRDFWIVVDRQVPSVCMSDPGFPIDLVLLGSRADYYRLWLGRISVRAAVRSGAIRATGHPAWTSRLESILQLSPAAALVAAPVTGRDS